ncbi:MAG: hypothetical protein DME75_10080 [Verrucomicrobia bacterium]|nr:MAG: hypothetical protein DME75_10080 [Verrucomicrobiota bacterium]
MIQSQRLIPTSNDLDCGRTSRRRKAFRRACGLKVDCVSGTRFAAKKDLSTLLLGRLIGDFSVNLEGVKAWRIRLTASLSPVADLP